MSAAETTQLEAGAQQATGATAQVTFLGTEPDPVLAYLHSPPDGGRGTAVLICPPFGWEEMCSYRARRRWAEALAAAGYPTARIDLPGTGDSGGFPDDPGRVAAWIDATAEASAWLRQRSGCERIVAIGIGLGGLVTYRAAAGGAPIDDLILWAVPASGRLLIRELRTYAGIVAARHPADARGGPALPEGASELIGFLLSAETKADLEAIKLTELELPRTGERRILLLGRDGLSPDKRLRAHLEERGAQVTVTDTDDYTDLMAHPQEALTPTHTIERSIAWLDEGPKSTRRSPQPTSARERSSVEMVHAGTAVRESPLTLRLLMGETVGVVTEPVDVPPVPLCAVLLNAGALRHIGPNRTWVEMARRWAALGVTTVRLDLAGIGDADGDERELVSNAALYARRSTVDALGLLDQLAQRGFPDRFVLGGLCSGAYWSLHAALADPRVLGVLMVNLYSFYWSEALVAERAAFENLGRLRDQGWRRLVRRDVRADQLLTAVKSIGPGRIRRGARHPVERSQSGEIERALDQLRDQGTETLMLLAYGEPLYDQLVRYGQIDALDRWPNLTLERIPTRDHMFRAIWLQQRVHESMDRALERTLARMEAETPE
jgi:pimeloyl-ACP methyl ester carboxylesterase